jgi:hypothetical protein
MFCQDHRLEASNDEPTGILYVSPALRINNSAFCGPIFGFMIVAVNSITQLIFVMVKCCVLFAARTEFLNII